MDDESWVTNTQSPAESAARCTAIDHMILVYNKVRYVIATHEHRGDFKV